MAEFFKEYRLTYFKPNILLNEYPHNPEEFFRAPIFSHGGRFHIFIDKRI